MDNEEKQAGINMLLNTIPKDILGNKDLRVVVFDTKPNTMPFIRLIIKDQDIAEILIKGPDRIEVHDLCNMTDPCTLADTSSEAPDRRYDSLSTLHNRSVYCKYARYNKPTSEFNASLVCPYTAICDQIKELAKAHPKEHEEPAE